MIRWLIIILIFCCCFVFYLAFLSSCLDFFFHLMNIKFASFFACFFFVFGFGFSHHISAIQKRFSNLIIWCVRNSPSVNDDQDHHDDEKFLEKNWKKNHHYLDKKIESWKKCQKKNIVQITIPKFSIFHIFYRYIEQTNACHMSCHIYPVFFHSF